MTTKQCRAYFDKKYDTFEASQDSLSLAGVANSVQQVQDLEQATRSGLAPSKINKTNKMQLIQDKKQSMLMYYKW
jgi:hypothetical protein